MDNALAVFGGLKSDNFKIQKLAVFDGKKIRKIWFKEEWWFSVVDIVGALTDSVDAKDYWYRLKIREKESSRIELSTICRQLKLLSSDGKKYSTDCTNTEGAFRIIQSIPSPKAEPFKLWLARTGYDRVQEIGDPELAQKRMRELYKQKGYSDVWIEKRVRGIIIRDELTDEWKKRDVGLEKEYAILTAEISKATFDMTPKEYKKYKGLDKQNLRDHMDDLELIFGMLGEKATTEIAKTKNAQGFFENKVAANKGGKIAGNARKNLEKETNKKVSTKENYLSIPEKKRKKLN
ncbi:MAG: Bro-N domain-containing protein [Candidatus ainarchaeum sp.]|nr:Bro-N domain-containing protein [Candidatus ainarchaeum sp.]